MRTMTIVIVVIMGIVFLFIMSVLLRKMMHILEVMHILRIVGVVCRMMMQCFEIVCEAAPNLKDHHDSNSD